MEAEFPEGESASEVPLLRIFIMLLCSQGKDDIQEMKKLVAETLQRNIDLEAENKWLREHSRGRPST